MHPAIGRTGGFLHRIAAVCIADAMLDAASIDELAELGVTTDTVDELSCGLLRNDDEFLVGVTRCVG